MKRLIVIIAALVAAAAQFAPVAAVADPHDERRAERRVERREHQYERRYERYEQRLDGPRGPRVLPGDRRAGSREPSVRPIPEARFRGPDGARYYGPPQASWRRGAILPPGARGMRVFAYDRNRLRPPPAGYVWYQVGPDFLLTDVRTGMILEVAPGY